MYKCVFDVCVCVYVLCMNVCVHKCVFGVCVRVCIVYECLCA